MMNIDLKMNRKKIIIISLITLLFFLIIVGVLIFKKNQINQNNESNLEEKIFVPEFLSTEEKIKLEIPAEAKIQAITRDPEGEIKVYRVMKNDSDIVDPATVGPISPRTKK